MPSSLCAPLEEEEEEEESVSTSIQPAKAYEDESVMLSGPFDNGQHKSTNRLLVLVPYERPHGS